METKNLQLQNPSQNISQTFWNVRNVPSNVTLLHLSPPKNKLSNNAPLHNISPKFDAHKVNLHINNAYQIDTLYIARF